MSTMSRFDAIRRTLDLCPEIVAGSGALRRLRGGVSIDLSEALSEAARLASKSSLLSVRAESGDDAALAELHRAHRRGR